MRRRVSKITKMCNIDPPRPQNVVREHFPRLSLGPSPGLLSTPLHAHSLIHSGDIRLFNIQKLRPITLRVTFGNGKRVQSGHRRPFSQLTTYCLFCVWFALTKKAHCLRSSDRSADVCSFSGRHISFRKPFQR